MPERSRGPPNPRPALKPFTRNPLGKFSSPEKPRIAKLFQRPPKLFCLATEADRSKASLRFIAPASLMRPRSISCAAAGTSLYSNAPWYARCIPCTVIFSTSASDWISVFCAFAGAFKSVAIERARVDFTQLVFISVFLCLSYFWWKLR